MRTRIEVLLLIAVLTVGGYTSAAWWSGMSVERQLRQNEDQLLNSSSYVTLISRDYHRGVFSSTEDVTYGIGGAIVPLLRTPGAAALLSSLQLTVHHTIEHGPLPGFRTLAFATIDSQLQPPAALRGAVETILHGQPLLQGHTTLHWSGDSELTLESPAFQYRSPEGVNIIWNGIGGTLHATRAMAQWAGRLSAPGLTVDGPKGRFELHGLTFSADMQRALDTFYIGSSEARLASLTAHGLSDGALSIQGIELQSDSNLNAGYLDQHARLTADRLDVAQFSLTRVGYEATLSHLHADSLAALIAALHDAQQEPSSGAITRNQAARTQMTAFSRYGLALAVHEPVLNIARFGFSAPEGQFRLSARVTIPGLSRQELQGPAAMVALMMHLTVNAELRIDAPLLDKLLDASGKREQVSTQLQQLEHQGYLRRDGNALTTFLAYHAGALTINGLPYQPMQGTMTP